MQTHLFNYMKAKKVPNMAKPSKLSYSQAENYKLIIILVRYDMIHDMVKQALSKFPGRYSQFKRKVRQKMNKKWSGFKGDEFANKPNSSSVWCFVFGVWHEIYASISAFQNTKHQTPNTKHQTPNTKHQTPNTKH